MICEVDATNKANSRNSNCTLDGPVTPHAHTSRRGGGLESGAWLGSRTRCRGVAVTYCELAAGLTTRLRGGRGKLRHAQLKCGHVCTNVRVATIIAAGAKRYV